jgi:hypothetical protein
MRVMRAVIARVTRRCVRKTNVRHNATSKRIGRRCVVARVPMRANMCGLFAYKIHTYSPAVMDMHGRC